MQGGGPRVQSRGEGFPPGVQHGVDGVGRAAAELGANLLDRRAISGAQKGVGGVGDVRLRDAAGNTSEDGGEHVWDDTRYVYCYFYYKYTNDNGSYHSWNYSGVTML